MRKVELGENSKVKIKWRVLPVDYTHEAEDNIKVKFARKYGISKDNVKVEPVFIMKKKDGTVIPFQNDITSKIQEPEFQRKLFKRYLSDHEITDCDFDQIIAIDDEINGEINYTLYEQNKRYSINWIKWSNFMSYGPDNYFDFRSVEGLVLLTSEPANQGGKTTFCLDLLRFLLFGKVTSREDDWVLARVFNKHLPEATEVTVEGCITIDGVDYIIKRTVSRPALKKRTDKSKVSQKVEYYKLVNNEYIDLADEECENESSVTETNKVIKDAIGNERDFDLMICVDADNLKGLISLKDTDRGRLVSRWIGLLSMEDKDKIAREKFNKTVIPTLMLNRYNKEDVKNDIKSLQDSNAIFTETINKDEVKIKESEKKLEEYTKTRDTLLSSKKTIDNSLLKVDVQTLESTMKNIKEEGKNKRIVMNENKKKFAEFCDVAFDNNEYEELRKKEKVLLNEVANCRVAYTNKKNDIQALKNGEYCPTCGAKLKNVDNTEKIKTAEKELEVLKEKGIKLAKDSEEITKKIATMEENRKKYEEKNKLQLIIEKNELDIENMLAKYRENERTLKDINDNKAAIENNNKIDTSLLIINENIIVENKCLTDLKQEVTEAKVNIEANNKTIIQSEKIIATIEKEEVLVKNWKLYLEMIGKNGISKMVIRTVLPLINGELKHLLSDVCDFDVEVVIDDHNDVAFKLIHDDVVSSLGSGSGFEQTVASLALRTVLSKISSFSKPSFVVFDEILGGVAAENYDALKRLYDKMITSYGTILEITHNSALVEWHKYFVTITKENNISKIKNIS